MFKTKNTVFFCIAALSFGLFAFSCKKQEKAPEPPLSKARMVIELYDALSKRDHFTAVKKIEKLRIVEPSNVFLAVLEISERNNIIVCNAQNKLDSGKIEEAEDIIKKMLQKHGLDETLASARDELSTIGKIKLLLDNLSKKDLDSFEMAKHAIALEKLSKDYAPANFLSEFALSKVDEARELYAWESNRAIEDLKSDRLFAFAVGPSLESTLLASLKIESGKNFELIFEAFTAKDIK